MPWYSPKQVLNLKLNTIQAPRLRMLARELGISSRGSAAEIIKKILSAESDIAAIDRFIKREYVQEIQIRRHGLSVGELRQELDKVKTFSWGIEQGQLDRKIQNEYVRRIVRYDELVGKINTRLHTDITNHVVCSWYNHWTTDLIEEHLATHPRVVPTLKSVKGIDLFFDGQPFDLKVTYVPRGYDSTKLMDNPTDLAVWMYENQGAQRFGQDNRLFIVLYDAQNPRESWKLKREFDLLFRQLDAFLDREKITPQDEIAFKFKGHSYTALTKVVLITK